MNQQQQIDIIAAHMAGKKVLTRPAENPKDDEWIEIYKGEYTFDFRHAQYKIEPRRVELFMALPSGVLQAMGREQTCKHSAAVSNSPIGDLPDGMMMVKINFLEP